MANWDRENLEAMSRKQAQEAREEQEYRPHTPKQRILAWIAIAVVLFGLAGTIYWMLKFVPGA